MAASNWHKRWVQRWFSSIFHGPLPCRGLVTWVFPAALELDPDVRFVQFIDGDCEVVDGWLEQGTKVIEEASEMCTCDGSPPREVH